MSDTTINPALYSGQYYPLPNQSTAMNDSTAGGDTSTDSVLQALMQATPQDSSPLVTTDLVDLSPQAQSILNEFGNGGTDNGSASNGFILSTQQQQQIKAILAKYKDAPFTQDTYNNIQADLKAAGLSPDQLSIQDEIRSFNPTKVMIDALNGIDDSSDISNFGNNPAEQANANSYMQQIFNQWQNISTTANSAGNS
jgi:hypothetical protein